MSTLATGLDALGSMPLVELIPLIGIPLYYIVVLLGYFTIRTLISGMPITERIKSGSRVMPRFLLEYGYWTIRFHTRLFIALRVTADQITILSLGFAVGGAVLIGMGRFALGGWLMFFSFFCDAFDGVIARHTGTSSDRGEFFDAVIDRYNDILTGLGFLYYYRNDPIPALLVALMMIGSSVMGYARAKGEAVGFDPNVGYMQRHERATYLGVLTVTSPIFAAFIEPHSPHPMFHATLFAIGLIAIFTNITAVWRVLYVLARMPKAPRPNFDRASANTSNPSSPAPETSSPSTVDERLASVEPSAVRP